MTLSDLAASLTSALADAERAHKALEEAKAALAPLEKAAIEADEAVTKLMGEYQRQSGFAVDVPVKRARGGRGGKRGPRSLDAIVMTSATRLLREMKEQSKAKKVAVNAALDRAGLVASKRNEKLTDQQKDQISAKADEIYRAK